MSEAGAFEEHAHTAKISVVTACRVLAKREVHEGALHNGMSAVVQLVARKA